MTTKQIWKQKVQGLTILSALLIVALLSAACTVQPIEAQPPSATEENKELVQQMIQRAFSEGDLNAIDEFVAVDFVEHEEGAPGQDAGRDGLKMSLTMLRTAFPDLEVTIEDIIAEGDKVVARLTWVGTHDGDFMGMPPTGNSFSMNVIDIFRIEEGQVVEHWGVADILAMMTQLGMMPGPEMGEAPAPQVETYTDVNGFFTVDYPAGWVVAPYGFSGDPTPHVSFGSQAEILVASEVGDPLPEDQIGVAVILLPRDMFAEQGVTAETPLEEIAQSVILSTAPEEAQAASAEATFESITLQNGTPAVRITMAAPTEAYVVHLVDMGEGIILLAPQILALDHENAELEAQVEAIINSVEVTASGEEIMAFIMGNMENIPSE